MDAPADIRLVVTDMDGTLLDAGRRLPLGFPEAVRTLADRGVAWAIASGRQLGSLQAFFAPLGLPLAIIAENGALAVEAGAREPFFRDLTPAAFFGDLVRAALAVPGAVPVLCGAERAWVAPAATPADLREIAPFFAFHEPWRDLGDALAREVCKVAVFHPRAAEALWPRLAPFARPDRRVILSGPQWIDVQPARIDKARALDALLRRRGLPPAAAIVFGDYLNDAGMMRLGCRSVAMANALPEIRALAGAVAPPNTERGVLRHLAAIGLLPALTA